MANQKNGIEWCDETWNPLRGCSRISDGCRNCYAETVAGRFSEPGMPYEGLITKTPKGPTWNGTIKLVPEKLKEPLRWQRPRRVFVNSMSDLFHENVPDDYIHRIFMIMALCPQHTFQVLTKRAERMLKYITGDYHSKTAPWPLQNVWLGVSVENQEAANERIPLLLQTPAAIRWISAEPLLGPIDLSSIDVSGEHEVLPLGAAWLDRLEPGESEDSRIDWVVVGGESGSNARPMHPDWARALRDQCRAAGIPFLFKQWGEYVSIYDRQKDDPDWRQCGEIERNNQPGRWLNLAGGHGFHGANVHFIKKVGKKRAGRILDGSTWDEYPISR